MGYGLIMRKALTSFILLGLLFQVSHAQELMSAWFVKPAIHFIENHPIAFGMLWGTVIGYSFNQYRNYIKKDFKKAAPQEKFKKYYQNGDGLKAAKSFIDIDIDEKEKLVESDLNHRLFPIKNFADSSWACSTHIGGIYDNTRVWISGRKESDGLCFTSRITVRDKKNERTKIIDIREWRVGS